MEHQAPYSELNRPVQLAAHPRFLALAEALRLLPVEHPLAEASLARQQVDPLRRNLQVVSSAVLSPEQLEQRPRYSVLRLSLELARQLVQGSSVLSQEQLQASLARLDNLVAYSEVGQQQRAPHRFLVNPQQERSQPAVRSLAGPSRKAQVHSPGARRLQASSSSNRSLGEHSPSGSP